MHSSAEERRDESAGENKETIECPLNCCHSKKIDVGFKTLRPLNLIIFMLFFGFSVSMRRHFRDNLIYRQMCIERLKSDYMICYKIKDSLNVTEKSFMVVDIIATSNSHVFSLMGLKLFVELFSSCLLCSWSDTYGRKIPLFIALLGESFEMSCYFLRDIPFEYFMWTYYTVTAITGLFGGYICIFNMCYCFVTDHSTVKTRALHFALINFTYVLGIIIGVMLYKKLKEDNMVLVSFACLIGARCAAFVWIWATFVDKKFNSKDDTLSKKVRKLFSSVHVKETYEAITRDRKSCKNGQLRLLILSALPIKVSYMLLEGIILLSPSHSKLFRSFTEYENMTSYIALYSCFVEIIALLIYHSLTKYKDSTLGIVGFCNLYLSFVIEAFAQDYLTFLVGLGITPLKGFASIGILSSYSKLAEETEPPDTGLDETGKVFYLYCCCGGAGMWLRQLLYKKISINLDPKDDSLAHMILCTVLVVSLSTFTFQMMCIHTDHLFQRCYRDVHIDAVSHRPDESAGSCRPDESAGSCRPNESAGSCRPNESEEYR